MPTPEQTEQAQKAGALVTNIIRLQGAVLMAAGPVIGFNVKGAADAIGLGHGDLGGLPTYKVIGGIAFVMGLWSYFITPMILQRARDKAGKGASQSGD